MAPPSNNVHCGTCHFVVRYIMPCFSSLIRIPYSHWTRLSPVVAIAGALLLTSNLASAQEKLISIVKPEARSQIWINPGFVSYHFDQNKNLNNGNWGAGAEYRFNTVASATIGRFYNSNREYSNYAGLYYQPIAIGPIKLGAVLGGFNGYPQTNSGGWFAAALPALTWEGDRVGANVFLIPTMGDRVNGAISVQLKLKVFDGR
jgi:hypothetical protein